MKNYLCEQSAQYLTELPYPIVHNLEYHFHTLDYGEFCRLLNALRQTLQRLAQVLYSKIISACPLTNILKCKGCKLFTCILSLVGFYNDERQKGGIIAAISRGILVEAIPCQRCQQTSTERCCIYRVRIENLSSYVSINC